MKILIDNGHGITTRGKRSPDGRLREYLYCREVAREIVNILRCKGYDAELLVPEDADISLGERVSRVNAHCDRNGAKRVCLVSIHINAAGMGDEWKTASYWSAWTSFGNTNGDKLANSLYRFAEMSLPDRQIKTDYADGDADCEASFTILKRTRCAAVLTENLFQDNKKDVDFLLSDNGRKAIIDLHVNGIIDYCSK